MAEVKLENIKPNSHKSKEANEIKERPKPTPVVDKSAVVSTKKPLSQKFADTFIKEDIDDVKSWLLMDVIIPGVKNTILDILGMMFFGGSGRGYRRNNQRYDERVSYNYNSYYKSDYNGRANSQRSRYLDKPSDSKVDYRNIILQRRDDAERVVGEMHRRIEDHGLVSIADMLDLMEITGKYTDNNWGWTDHNDIGIRRVPNGYLIDVSEAKLID